MKLDLSNKRALVSGSSSGIGAAIAEMLAQEGATVVVHGRDAEKTAAVAKAIREKGWRVAHAVGDLATDEGAADVVRAAFDALGGVDILVNNAGGRNPAFSPGWFETPVSAWIETYQSNTIAAVRLINALVAPMCERGWGRVINISSLAAQSTAGIMPDYGAAKSAMSNMTLGLSKALRRTGVTVNTVSPGAIQTASNEWQIADTARMRNLDRQQAIDFLIDHRYRQTVGRLGDVNHVAAMVCLLASPLADYVNGANVRVDGGASQALN
jgi:NAD(P)-dependent dehydrogenase (short-subunit alcohol dehydrogenase family)